MGRPREPDQVTVTSGVAILPRASLIVGPFRSVSLSASYGQGVRSVDPIYITQDVQAPFANVVAYEAGAAYTGTAAEHAAGRAVASCSRRSSTRTSSSTRRPGATCIGVGTTRTGWLGALRWTGRSSTSRPT